MNEQTCGCPDAVMRLCTSETPLLLLSGSFTSFDQYLVNYHEKQNIYFDKKDKIANKKQTQNGKKLSKKKNKNNYTKKQWWLSLEIM